MFRLMCCHSRKGKIQNDCIWEDIDDTYPEDDNKKSIKAVWTYAKKATEGTGEESRLHDF